MIQYLIPSLKYSAYFLEHTFYRLVLQRTWLPLRNVFDYYHRIGYRAFMSPNHIWLLITLLIWFANIIGWFSPLNLRVGMFYDAVLPIRISFNDIRRDDCYVSLSNSGSHLLWKIHWGDIRWLWRGAWHWNPRYHFPHFKRISFTYWSIRNCCWYSFCPEKWIGLLFGAGEKCVRFAIL